MQSDGGDGNEGPVRSVAVDGARSAGGRSGDLLRKEHPLLAGLYTRRRVRFFARHQQVVLKKKCSPIDTMIQYKPGAGGDLVGVENSQTLVTSCRIPQRNSIGRR